MIIHIRHERGLNHAIVQMPDAGPLAMISWSTTAPRATTARPVNTEEVQTIMGHWRDMQERKVLEVVSADWAALKVIAPLETA